MLLFSSLSVAAYACPEGAGGSDAATTMPDGCPDQDAAQPNLCQAHCTAAQQRSGQSNADFQPLSLMHGLLAVLHPPAPAQSMSLHRTRSRAFVQATAPPISIRNCCFRL